MKVTHVAINSIRLTQVGEHPLDRSRNAGYGEPKTIASGARMQPQCLPRSSWGCACARQACKHHARRDVSRAAKPIGKVATPVTINACIAFKVKFVTGSE